MIDSDIFINLNAIDTCMYPWELYSEIGTRPRVIALSTAIKLVLLLIYVNMQMDFNIYSMNIHSCKLEGKLTSFEAS